MPHSTAPPVTDVDLRLAREVLEIEAAAITSLVARIDERFAEAVTTLDACAGRVIVTGMGKSGIISRKIAATLSSTGTPAFFLHPAEAVHGDLGVIQADDVVVALSHTGETSEILRLLETIKRVGARVICLTGDPHSTLADAADVTLDCQVRNEACPMNLVPTASTTAALAMGDALAMTLLVKKGFGEHDFAGLHPGGGLGKRLLRTDRLMHAGDSLPVVVANTPMRTALQVMSDKGHGMTCVSTSDGRLAGVITDGDLRRRLAGGDSLTDDTAGDVMTTAPHTIGPATLAAQALQVMEAHRITSLVVVDDRDQVLGVLHLHDLWRTELF
ncbi:MAG: KpsF/GutQ family sugar-phosphate isomerase [Vicinamibacterales bacterium]|nr:KpsF/GutQ family sugar-phosphate isomerase [Vicinamibacterales bacterium]